MEDEVVIESLCYAFFVLFYLILFYILRYTTYTHRHIPITCAIITRAIYLHSLPIALVHLYLVFCSKVELIAWYIIIKVIMDSPDIITIEFRSASVIIWACVCRVWFACWLLLFKRPFTLC